MNTIIEAATAVLLGEKKITIDVDYACDDTKACAKIAKKHKVKIKANDKNGTADVSGDQKNVIAWLKASGYDDLEELYPELF